MAPRKRVSFATFNLYNLNEAGMRMYRNPKGWTTTQYNRKIKWTAQVISSLGADVWGFQELWHHRSLNAVFGKVAQVAQGKKYELLVPNNHHDKITCVAAVREHILVGEPEWIEQFPNEFILSSKGEDDQTTKINVSINKFSRPVLHFRVQPREKSLPISVYVAHFKSKNPTGIYCEDWYKKNEEYYKKHSEGIGSALSTIRRTAEAAALRMIITEKSKDNNEPIVVLGDLNDGVQSTTLNIIAGNPNYLRAPWAQGGSDTDLYSVGVLQCLRSLRDVYYTHQYKKIHETLDHILVSQELYDHSKNQEWGFRKMKIVNDHLNDDDHKSSGTTDHGVVMAEFEYRTA